MDCPNLSITDPGSYFTEDGGVMQVEATALRDLERWRDVQARLLNGSRQPSTTRVKLQEEAASAHTLAPIIQALQPKFWKTLVQGGTFKTKAIFSAPYVLLSSSMYFSSFDGAAVPICRVALRLHVAPSNVNLTCNLPCGASAAKLAVTPILAPTFLVTEQAAHVVAEDDQAARMEGASTSGSDEPQQGRAALQHTDAFVEQETSSDNKLPSLLQERLVRQGLEDGIVPKIFPSVFSFDPRASPSDLGRVDRHQGSETSGHACGDVVNGELVFARGFANTHFSSMRPQCRVILDPRSHSARAYPDRQASEQ